MNDVTPARLVDHTRVVTADRGDAGCRLDLVLRRHLCDMRGASRTRIQRLIEGGRVSVNSTVVRRVAARAASGDVVTVTFAGPPKRTMAGENIALAVLYEDEHLLAVDKPAGVVAHPTRAHAQGTLMNALLWHARHWPAPMRPSLVGRLDKLTSGIVLVAKTAAAHAALQQAMRSPDCDKDYLAVVYGQSIPARGEIELPIHDDGTPRRLVCSAGMPSLTCFERLTGAGASHAWLSVLRCRLVTGRTHQIRVHLAARGWPIVGDAIYGEPRWSSVTDAVLASALATFPRQALHAWRLRLTHPVSGYRLQLEAAIPGDITGLLAVAGLPVDARQGQVGCIDGRNGNVVS